MEASRILTQVYFVLHEWAVSDEYNKMVKIIVRKQTGELKTTSFGSQFPNIKNCYLKLSQCKQNMPIYANQAALKFLLGCLRFLQNCFGSKQT